MTSPFYLRLGGLPSVEQIASDHRRDKKLLGSLN